ncbi:DivIVA domain-containing protein [Mumia zhuanghuii]|uniref:Cell wall synthesis protein Wag31 n=2 Tax=Mumia TaxID=1546255 RepID=A0ABW1QL14_9ACTN|nr:MULTISPECIES: DivIVA domain-containing protein [Mumia]KAA1418310.1 DivIVA domain-containing protein [Mumia zhuanghuii]
MTTPIDVNKIASEIRRASFTVRRRGFDEDEVGIFLRELATAVQRLEDENDSLRTELKARDVKSTEPISAQAVIMFAEAQKIADSLIDEAVSHARELMVSARSQQRDIVRDAHAAAAAAAEKAAETAEQVRAEQSRSAPDNGDGSGGTRYDHPIAEIEYVRTFAKVAQIQLRSVLDALTEQVDALGEMPRLDQVDESRQRPRRDR